MVTYRMTYVAAQEKLNLPPALAQKITDKSDRNLRRAIILSPGGVTPNNGDVRPADELLV